MTYEQFHDEVYQHFLTVFSEKRGWYFTLRKGGGTVPLYGTEKSRYAATSFWKMTSREGMKLTPTLAIMVYRDEEKYFYKIALKQRREPLNAQDESVLKLIQSVRIKNIWRQENMKDSRQSSKDLTLSIYSESNYDSLEKLFVALEEDLESVIPQVDEIIAGIKVDSPNFDARRVTKSDMDAEIVAYENRRSDSRENLAAETVLSVQEWLSILQNENLTGKKEREILEAFYVQPGHGAHAFEIDQLLRPERATPSNIFVNKAMSDYSAKIEQKSGLKIVRHEHLGETKGYFRILFSLEKNEVGWKLTLLPNLMTALSKLPLENNQMTGSVKSSPLNQILHGPPGTGKTYRTITEAVKIVNPNFSASSRKAWTEEYRRLVDQGRIVFTTFHQSLSYEDFVEGLKPVLGQQEENNDVQYEIKVGIFKKLATEAAYAIYEQHKSSNKPIALDYADRFDAYLAYVREQTDEGGTIALPTKSGKGATIIGVTDRGNIQVKHDNGERVYTVSKDRQVRLDEGIADFDNLNENIYTLFSSIIGGSNASVHWAVMNQVRKFSPPAIPKEEILVSLETKAKVIRSMSAGDFARPNAPNHILIIDEINRGNISRIFGELITLLEPDKRLGQPEALTVTLPYSRATFGVPPNLYLIGTMNTADRSVVALDSALRRRFRFTEVPPDPGVITKALNEGKFSGNPHANELARIMTTLNERIKFLLDADHCIGHSYFLKMSTAEATAEQFHTGIIPLLREYFYEDHSQLQLVLGSGFIKAIRMESKQLFPGKYANGRPEASGYQKYEIIDFRQEPTGLANALAILLNGETTSA